MALSSGAPRSEAVRLGLAPASATLPTMLPRLPRRIRPRACTFIDSQSYARHSCYRCGYAAPSDDFATMLDPAIMLDLQRAMVPPSLPPLAIVREWASQHDAPRQTLARAMLAAAEHQLVGWHGVIDRQLADFEKLAHIVWEDSDRAMFDQMIANTEATAERTVHEVEKAHRRDLRNNDRLARLNPINAREERAFLNKVHGWQRDNIEKMLEVALHLRAFRAKHDGRSNIVGTFDDSDDLTAFLEAAIAA